MFRIKGRGIRRTISISNTRKITARRKNRKENGIRALPRGSNPHSKGEDFSRSSIVRWASKKETSMTTIARARAKKMEVRDRVISLEV